MSKNLSAFTFVYTSDRIDACGVRMYTDKSSEVCTIRFGNSFTLPVVSPQDLVDFAHEILSFAQAAEEYHYPEAMGELSGLAAAYPSAPSELPFDPSDEVARESYEEMGGISRASVQGIDKVPTEPYVPVEQEPSKVGKMMMGTVSAPEWNPNDPINW